MRAKRTSTRFISCSIFSARPLSLQEGLARAQQERGDEETEAFFLVIDQFEEIFTLDPHRHDERRDFFVQLHEALEAHPRVTLILAMREEYLAHLDPFLSYLPDRLRTRFRLDLLGPEAARQAIVEPAQQANVPFTASAARRLVDDLGRGQPVDPVQLQVVCHRLWSRRPADAAAIDDALVAGFADVDHALADYYAERVQSVARETGVDERAIRLWFERELITPQGFRGQALAGEAQKLDARAVAALVDCHLVRAEARHGAVWYELAHDRLIQPVRDDNAEWLAQNERPIDRLAQRASLWQKEGKPKRLLLKGSALRQAEREAESHREEISSLVQDLLQSSRKGRSRRRKLWIAGGFAGLLLVLLLVAFLFFAFAVLAGLWGYQSLMNTFKAGILASQGRGLDIPLLFGAYSQHVEAWGQEHAANLLESPDLLVSPGVPDSRALLFSALAANPSLAVVLHEGEGTVLSLGWSADGTWLAAGTSRGKIRLWDAASHSPRPLSFQQEGAVTAVAIRPDGRRLATLSEAELRLWDPAAAQALVRRMPAATAAAFTADGQVLLTGQEDGTVSRWDGSTGDSLGPPWRVPASRIAALAVSLDGRLLAVAGADGQIHRWSLTAQQPLGPALAGPGGEITGLAFSRDSRALAAGSRDGIYQVLDAASGALRAGPVDAGVGPVAGLAFSPQADVLAVGGLRGTIALWKPGDPQPLLLLNGPETPRLRLAFSPDGRFLASTHGSKIAVWRTESGLLLGQRIDPRAAAAALSNPSGPPPSTSAARPTCQDGIVSSAFNPQRTLLAAGCGDGEVQVLSVDPHSLAAKGLLARFRGAVAGRAVRLAFSPAGDLLAAADEEGAISLWDPHKHSFVAGPLRGHQGALTALAFEKDGKHLLSLDQGIAVRWDIDPASWLARACAIANRDLTPEEWQRIIPMRNIILYEPVCKIGSPAPGANEQVGRRNE
jgi:WD40 repeat protein